MKFLRIPLGTYFGVPLIMHPTLTALLAFACLASFLSGSPHLILYLSCIYLSVILHEYGHVLAAQKLNYECQEVVMSFIGGIAKINIVSIKPKDEFIISICGPLVNLAICVLLTLFWLTLIKFDTFANFIGSIIIINLVIMSFNLIPAFPMDGGRILRSALQLFLKVNSLRATILSVRIGQTIAFFGFVYSIYYYNISIFFIAPICAFLGQSEIYRAKQLSNEEILKNLLIEISNGKSVQSVRAAYLDLVHDKNKAECLLDFLEDWQYGNLDNYKDKFKDWTDKIIDLEGEWESPVKEVVIRESVKNAGLFIATKDRSYLKMIYDPRIKECVRFKTSS